MQTKDNMKREKNERIEFKPTLEVAKYIDIWLRVNFLQVIEKVGRAYKDWAVASLRNSRHYILGQTHGWEVKNRKTGWMSE